jgi:hypothetical protein
MNTFVPFPKDRGPESLREVLSRLFTSKRIGQVSAQARLENAWGEAAGLELRQASRAVILKRGILEVHVRDAVTHQQLVMQKDQLVEQLKAKLGSPVSDIRFRVQ